MTESRQGRTFLSGLFGGALVGTAIGVLFAPRVRATCRSLQRQLEDMAADAGGVATERYRGATAKAGDAVDDLQRKGRGLYDKALNVVVRGVDAVEERAADAGGGAPQSQ